MGSKSSQTVQNQNQWDSGRSTPEAENKTGKQTQKG